jgi:hypothetical protein
MKLTIHDGELARYLVHCKHAGKPKRVFVPTNPTCLYLRQARKTPRSLRPRNCRTSGFDIAAFIPNGAQPTFDWIGLHASDD